jgi:hypothetical protein
MPNSSYLCATDRSSLYPSTTEKDFAPPTDVVAYDVRCVPLLWLAMFRPADLLTQTIVIEPDPDAVHYEIGPDGDFVEIATPEGEDEIVTATAPLAPKDRALAQLDAAVPMLNRLFAAEGPLDDHAAMLRRVPDDRAGRDRGPVGTGNVPAGAARRAGESGRRDRSRCRSRAPHRARPAAHWTPLPARAAPPRRSRRSRGRRLLELRAPPGRELQRRRALGARDLRGQRLQPGASITSTVPSRLAGRAPRRRRGRTPGEGRGELTRSAEARHRVLGHHGRMGTSGLRSAQGPERPACEALTPAYLK